MLQNSLFQQCPIEVMNRERCNDMCCWCRNRLIHVSVMSDRKCLPQFQWWHNWSGSLCNCIPWRAYLHSWYKQMHRMIEFLDHYRVSTTLLKIVAWKMMHFKVIICLKVALEHLERDVKDIVWIQAILLFSWVQIKGVRNVLNIRCFSHGFWGRVSSK